MVHASCLQMVVLQCEALQFAVVVLKYNMLIQQFLLSKSGSYSKQGLRMKMKCHLPLVHSNGACLTLLSTELWCKVVPVKSLRLKSCFMPVICRLNFPCSGAPGHARGEYYIPTQCLDLATYPGFLNSGASIIQGHPVRGSQLPLHAWRSVLPQVYTWSSRGQLYIWD